MFNKKGYNIKYLFTDETGYTFDSIERTDNRVPNVGEMIHFICRGNRINTVIKIQTELTHSSEDVYYKVFVK